MNADSPEVRPGRTIIVVLDDDNSNRLGPMGRAVEAALPDVTFLSCSTVAEAIELVETRGSEIVVLSLDYDLADDGAFQDGRRIRPTCSGMDVVRHLQTRKPEFEVIVHSASREATLMREELIAAGYTTVLATPAVHQGTDIPDTWLTAVQAAVRRSDVNRGGALL